MTPAPTVALVGSLDTKPAEYGAMCARLEATGVRSLLIDVGVLGEPGIAPDVPRDAVARSAGATIAELVSSHDRNAAIQTMADGASRLIAELVRTKRVSGVLMVGGSNAGYVMARITENLPVGVPKMLVSTIAAGDTRPYVVARDLTMMYPVVDIEGLNTVSSGMLARAVDAMAGMVRGTPVAAGQTHRRRVALSMFGITTRCVAAVRAQVEAEGWEALVFHATGVGGAGMEAMIDDGVIGATIDVTTTELADDLVGGVCSAGADRLTAAGRRGIAQVMSSGALDVVNFGPMDTIPERLADRQMMAHNPNVTLVRTSPDENAELGRRMAARVNSSLGAVSIEIPARGFSQISEPGGPFHDPAADAAFIDTLRAELREPAHLHVHDLAIEDSRFAELLATSFADITSQ
ncbi:Tm-1-like ATP-binding domain-containing protein [Brachybacterium sacelli]|uniref:Uncharacterized protein (UPF0261 family) n=1 Tax=Brachybacterium sacelli TaxID=173364 RepID=A0ABS4WX11_9MICO|nr:Tm-1-like ATP-binding domain-containing protein [Brachybacterium sacelli]MBP2380728.1 uncharacterized protein (UPF0261 family) [Brachybacterium sacelli]